MGIITRVSQSFVDRAKRLIPPEFVSDVTSASAIGSRDANVAKPSQQHREAVAACLLPRALMGGTDAMRSMGTMFMPQHPEEEQQVYDLRLNSTILYNGYERTVKSQAAKMFAEPVNVKEAPDVLRAYCENVDGQGRGITAFGLDAMTEAMVDGIAFIFIDFPVMPTGSTMADQLALGIRPFWTLLTVNQILGVKFQNVGGNMYLTQLRIAESACVDDGRFGEKQVERVRVLEPGHYELYEKRKDERGNVVWVLIEEADTSLNFIPVVPVYTNRTGFFEGRPPLKALAEMNLEHWNSSSEQRQALTFARFAMLAIIGASDDEKEDIKIAPSTVLYAPDGGDVKYVESNGNGITAGREDLKHIEERMQHAGMELRVENAGQVTATAAALDSAETNAGLLAVANGFENSLEEALLITGVYLNLPEDAPVDVELYKMFAKAQPQGTVGEISMLRNSRIISLPTTWTELKRRHVLSDEFDEQEELLLIEAEAQAEAEMMLSDPNQPQ